MMCAFRRRALGLAALVLLAAASAALAEDKASETTPSPSSGEKYTLRYKFGPGQTLRWKIVHRARVDASVAGVSQSSESVSSSVKVWKVSKVDPNGTATFEQLVENVDMWQKLTGRLEVRYNSQTDKVPPVGFENVAKSIGVPLSRTTIDPQGKILARSQLSGPSKAQQEGLLTIPLPDVPVAVGESWSFPCDFEVPLEGGKIRKIKARQTFTLEAVKESVATVRVGTEILTPVDDPAVEAQLMQRDSTGTVSFDVKAGRVVGQQMDTDKRVVGFRGQTSSLHYRTQFTEELLAQKSEGPSSEPKAEAGQAKSSGTAKTAPASSPPKETPATGASPNAAPKSASLAKPDKAQTRK